MTTKRKIILFATLIFTFIILIVTARIYKIYAFYNIPSSAMDPTYPIDKKVFGSSLCSTKKKDVVVYLAEPLPYEQSKESYEVLGRIVAVENDTLEIIDGLLYVNQKMVDDTMNLSYFFKVPIDIDRKFSEYQKQYKSFQISDSTLMLNASYKEVKVLGIDKSVHRQIDTSQQIDPRSFNVNNSKMWTMDNFGPVVVPKDCYFIMGDNRSNSADSRFRGFIHKDKIEVKIITGQ